MEFLDNSGHIFSLPSYKEEPIGYEFEENDYIFWIDSSNSNKLSINNYYTRTINLVIPYNLEIEDEKIDKKFDSIMDIKISIDSNKFWLLKPIDIQEMINNNYSIKDYLEKSNILVKDNPDVDKYKYQNNKLTNDDLYVLTIKKGEEDNWGGFNNLAILPIYIISTSGEEGTWITNILIHTKNKITKEENWCPISVGGEYTSENEILTINGTNMGINLPKDIFRSIYQVSFHNNEFNESIYNEKIKEYLINYMGIKGEIGNYKSAISSLKWFGYGDKVQLTKLIKTDNEIKEQYINDYFNISTDTIKSFKYFRNSTLLSLKLKYNEDTGESYEIDMNNDFWGEGKPKLENLFDKQIEEEVGFNNDKWSYWKPYYDFSFYDMGLKISCLKYYYEKYFLPIHLSIHSASIVHKVYANDIKMTNHVFNINITENPILLGYKNQIEFNSNDVRYFTHQLHYVDEYYNEYTSFDEDKEDVYKIEDTCLNVPIKFINDVDEQGNEVSTYFNCVLILEKEKKENEYFSPYRLNILKPFNVFKYDLIINEYESKNKLDLNKYLFSYSLDKKNYSSWYSGYDNLIKGINNQFKIKLNTINDIDDPTYNLVYITNNTTGELSLNILWDNIEENSIHKIFDQYVDENKINELIEELKKYQINSLSQEINTNDWYVYIPSIDDLEFNPMHIEDVVGNIIIIPKLYLRIKFDNTEIDNINLIDKYNNTKISYKDYIKINYIPESTVIYESHFSFTQTTNKKYNSFVLYPKVLSKININYFVNQKFKIRLLVNDKWYFYEFTSKMPDLNLEFGKLQYKYWNTTDNYYSNFSQLKDFCPNKINDNGEIEKGYIKFNSFMYEPEFVTTDHINYYKDISEYIRINNIKYVDDTNEDLRLYNFSKYVTINGDNINCKIYIHKNLTLSNKLKEIYIYREYLKYPSIRYISEDLVFGEIDKNTFKIISPVSYGIINILGIYEIYNQENTDDYKINKTWEKINNIRKKYNLPKYTEEITIDNINTLDGIINLVNKNIPGNDNEYFKDKINYIIKIDRSLILTSYEFIKEENKFNEIKEDGYIINIYENIISEVKNIYQKFNFNLNINKNNYLNNIHIFDIYEPYTYNLKNNVFKNLGNININCNGINFSHRTNEDKVYLNGVTLYNEDVDSRYVDMYGFYTYYWDKTKEISDDHNLRLQLNYHKLEQFLQDKTETRYYYYVDNNGNPTNERISEIKYEKEIAEIVLDKLEDIENINKFSINNYTLLNDDYKDLGGFKYIKSNKEYGKNSKMIYLIKGNGNILEQDNSKNIIINISFVSFDGSEITSLNNRELMSIYKNEPLDNIKIKVVFYEYVTEEYNNYLKLYEENSEYKVIKENNNYILVKNNGDHFDEDIKLSLDLYNKYIDERNQCVIPVDEVLDVVIEDDVLKQYIYTLGNPAFRFLKFGVHTDINANEDFPIFVIDQEDYSIKEGIENILPDLTLNNIDVNSNLLYENNFNSLEEYLDFINAYVGDITRDDIEKYETYKKINDIYTYWNKFEGDDYEEKLNIIKEKLSKAKEAKTQHDKDQILSDININQYVNFRDNIIIAEVNFDNLDINIDKNDNCECILDWETNDNRIYLELEISKEIYEKTTNYDDSFSYIGETIISTDIKKEYKSIKGSKFTLYRPQREEMENSGEIYDGTFKKHYKEYLYKYTLYIKVRNDGNEIRLNNAYIKPLIYTIDSGYQKLRYNPSNDNSSVVYINNSKYIYDNNNSEEIINLYDKFFEVNYISTENGRKENIIYEVEKIYEIENKYLVWAINNKLYYNIIRNNTILSKGNIIISCNGIEYVYNKLNNKSLKFEGNIIKYGNELLSDIDTSNLLNMIKYDFSVKTKSDFYECKVYKVNNDNIKEEVIIKDPYILENYVKLINSKVNLKKYLDYDFYLMHDFDYWYGVFISKQTINKSMNRDQLVISDKSKEMVPTKNLEDVENLEYENNTDYILKHINSSNEFLINRMQYIPNNGINHFGKTDLIVGKIKNNPRLPVNVFDSSKWNISPISIGTNQTINIESNSEMAILSFPSNNNEYEKGYYDVKVRYSLDGNTQQQYIKKGKIRIG